ncbi:replication initiation factor domain-containing protein [Roseburia hominis]
MGNGWVSGGKDAVSFPRLIHALSMRFVAGVHKYPYIHGLKNELEEDREMGLSGATIRERRKEDHMTQKELAELLQISPTYLAEIETGRRKASDKLLERIKFFLDLYRPDTGLEILLDYCRIRFSSTDIKHILEDVLGIRLKYMIRENHALYGYSAQYLMGDIVVMHSEDEKLGCLLELKGKGCRQFEIFLNAQGRTWFDFFRQVEMEHGVYKRIDIAINDKAGWLDIPYLAEKCRKEEYSTIFRAYRNYQSGELIRAREDDRDQMGNTLYLGSMKSEIYFCIYEKDYEQYVKAGREIEDADVKNRFEIRLKDDRATYAVEDLLDYEDPAKTAFGIINRYVTFLTPKAGVEDITKWDVDPMWARFIGGEDRQLKLTDAPEPYTLERTLNWIRRQVAPSFKMLHQLAEIRGEADLLDRMIDEAKLSPQHKKLLKQQQTEVKEMLAERFADMGIRVDPDTGEIVEM